MSGNCLEIRGLTLDYLTPSGTQRALADVSLDVVRGEVLGLVGESGSGKSTLAYQMLGYRQPNARLVAGSVMFGDIDVVRLPADALQRLRGNRIGFVPQNPTTALNPAMIVFDQIAEVLRTHRRLERDAIAARFDVLMRQVGLAAIPDVGKRYPHRLSGGQQQRIAIAMALACEPELIVLDEPTTGLDVTVQQQIIELLEVAARQPGRLDGLCDPRPAAAQPDRRPAGRDVSRRTGRDRRGGAGLLAAAPCLLQGAAGGRSAVPGGAGGRQAGARFRPARPVARASCRSPMAGGAVSWGSARPRGRPSFAASTSPSPATRRSP